MYDNVDEEDRTKLPMYVCKDDILNRNRANKDRFGPYAIKKAESILTDATAIFTRSRSYLNYRQRFIAVKVEAVTREDKIEHGVRIDRLIKESLEAGIKVKHLRKHIIFEVREGLLT